jgi:hypothetical protein
VRARETLAPTRYPDWETLFRHAGMREADVAERSPDVLFQRSRKDGQLVLIGCWLVARTRRHQPTSSMISDLADLWLGRMSCGLFDN